MISQKILKRFVFESTEKKKLNSKINIDLKNNEIIDLQLEFAIDWHGVVLHTVGLTE